MEKYTILDIQLSSFLALVVCLSTAFLALACQDDASTAEATGQQATESPVAIAIHGGAGTILPENMTAEQEEAYRTALQEALEAGYEVLQGGGSSIEAVIAAIQPMEESELFNAGRGAVFTSEETVELDASIMDGRTLNAGAVSGLQHTRSPIALARLVMEESPHVMLYGQGAESYGEEHGLEQVPNEYFYTERRLEQLRRAQEQEATSDAGQLPPELMYGTVGAVALDQNGNLAAGTSTGGTTNKRFGRIGDSPIIGAGTYADNEACAVSATGHGEFFIRKAVAHDICAKMSYAGMSLDEAATTVIMEELVEMDATGGVIALDAQGNISMPFNTPGMYRGSIGPDGSLYVEIYQDQE